MKNENRLVGAGLISALMASLCCITPVLALIIGTSGIASAFSWTEPLRPYLIGLTLLVLGLAWYKKLYTKKEIDCECKTDNDKKFLHSKIVLGMITIFSITLLAFPYYSGIFYPNPKEHGISVNRLSIKTVTLKISGMTCTACEEHIKHAVNKLNGIVKIDVSYENAGAKIEFDSTKTSITTIENVINETSYQVTH